MGKYKGKAKQQAKAEPIKSAPAEFSDDSDAVFSDEDDEQMDDDDAGEMNEILSPAEEDEDDDEDDEEALHWGNKKSAFFKDAGSSEEEDGEDEELAEEEATRMLKKRQNALKKEDLEIGGDDEDEDDDRSGPVVVRKAKKASARASAEDDDEDLLATEAPEVLALLNEFGAKAEEIRDSIQPVLERLTEEKEAATSEGVAYLETKTHLLLSYVTNVAFYLLYRAENGAAKAESHPVVSQLVRLRTLLEKLRPLDAKLKNELDELVRRALTSGASETEEEEDEGEEEQSAGDDEEQRTTHASNNKQALGRGGKPLPVSSKHGFRPELNDFMGNGFEGDDDREASKSRKQGDREERKRLARAEKSSLVRELREEMSEAPTEILDDLRAVSGKDSEYEEDKRRYEEENFTRIRETKKMRAKLGKSDKSAAVHGGDLNTLAAELEEAEFTKFKDLLDDDDGGEAKSAKKGALSMHLNEMAQARKVSKSMFQGGDDDVIPTKRKQTETRRQQQQSMSNDDDEVNTKRVKFAEHVEVDPAVEHPYFAETVGRRKAASKEKEESYQFPKRFAPAPVKIVEAGQSRFASREMIKNRGLTPHRSKDKKNPRKNIRDKYEAKVKARRGQVRDVRSGEGDYYQGEKSGIRANVVRSRQAGKI